MAKYTTQSKKPDRRLRSLPADAYTGKQERIKKELTQKLKLQRKYAQVLKAEGLEPTISAAQTRPEPQTTVEPTDIADDFTNFDALDESSPSKTDSEAEAATDSGKKSKQNYRQRAKAHKNTGVELPASKIKHDQKITPKVTPIEESYAERIKRKQDDRSRIVKREQTKTRKGQPKMNDRMKNILEKLMTDT